jgi:hypothetical protein
VAVDMNRVGSYYWVHEGAGLPVGSGIDLEVWSALLFDGKERDAKLSGLGLSCRRSPGMELAGVCLNGPEAHCSRKPALVGPNHLSRLRRDSQGVVCYEEVV